MGTAAIRYAVAICVALAAAIATGPRVFSVPVVTPGTDVKVISDNNNVDGGPPTPSFDSQNRQQNETSVAISPVDPNIVVGAANDYRLVPAFADAWVGFYVSSDGGATWFNTMVPGFPTDTSAAGLASPLLGLDGSGDPVVRFDAEGNLYVAGLAANRDFDQEDRNNDTVVFAAKYTYTPGTPGGTSTPGSAANPPNFTYAFTTIVDRGAVAFAIPPGQPFGFAGILDDKNWMAVDTTPTSPCHGNVYYTYTKFTGLAGAFPILFSRSTDGGQTFSEPKPIAQRGRNGTQATQGSYIVAAPDGTVYVSYRTFPTNSDPTNQIHVVRSSDCGVHFGKPITAATFTPMPRQAAGLTFRTPLETAMAVDDTDSHTVYVAYMALNGTPSNADIFVVRSTDGGVTWGAPVKVNDDATAKHQFWPTIDVSNGLVHVAWYDFRDSPTPGDPAATNTALNVYYAPSLAGPGLSFGGNVKVTDVPHNPNCLMFSNGTVGFHGDYIELDSRWDGSVHTVHLAWADNRDVTPCDLDPAPGPASNNTGNRNQNVYADTLTIQP